MAVSANRLELLQIAEAVAREKNIDRSIVLSSMEEALQKAARSRYGQETEVRAEINPRTGETRFSRLLLVVDEIENDATQILMADARRKNPAAQVGDWIAETLPPFEFGRIAGQSAKQVIVQKLREAERDKQYDEYKDRIADIINGVVKRVEYGNVVVDLQGRGEAVVRRDELIPRETFRPGDRIRAYVYDVRREQRGPQIFLSRTHPQFMSKLFTQEVPEIYDGIIEVKAVARDPGSRAKIGVTSRDSSIDPVGACVGMRGSRVQAVVNELQGEKIDIIPWSPDAATFIVNALQPAEVVKVVLDEDSSRIEVVVPDDQLSLAIGRRGQNVRLASQLTGWDIDILTEAEESERRQKEFVERTNLFMEALDVDEVVGQLLASEGFRSLEELAYVEPAELSSIEGFDEDTASEIQARARGHLQAVEEEFDRQRRELGVDDDSEGDRRHHHGHDGEAGRKRREDCRGSGRLRPRRSRGLDGAEGRRVDAPQRLPRKLRDVAGGCRSRNHGGACQGRLDRGRGSGRRRERGSASRGGCRLSRQDRATMGGDEASEPNLEGSRSRSRPIRRRRATTRAPNGPVSSRGSRGLRKLSPVRFVARRSGRPGSTAGSPGTRRLGDGRKGRRRRSRETQELWTRLQSAAGGGSEPGRHGGRALGEGRVAGVGHRQQGWARCRGRRQGGRICGPKVPAALVHASDGSLDGIRKLEAAVRRRLGDDADAIARIRIFRSDQLDLALGRTNVIHAAVAGGTAGDGFVSRSRRLDRYRGSPPAEAAGSRRSIED